MLCVTSCVPVGTVVSTGASAFAAYKSHRAEQAVKEAVPCDALAVLKLSDEAIGAANQADLQQLVAHNRIVSEFCPER